MVGFSSSSIAPCTVTGKIVDLRSPAERNNEARARTPLEPDDEKIAQELACLSRELELAGNVDIKPRGKSSDPRCRRMREIGEFLCSRGGTDRMDLICYRVIALTHSSTWCRLTWEGVCGWEV